MVPSLPTRGVLAAAARGVDRALPLSVRRRVRYLAFHHHLLSLSHPRTFTEKVQWRMVHDHRDLLAPTCDKLAMKAAAERVPDVRVPTTYWAGTDLRELSGVALPGRWVLKPNHRFGLVHFGSGRPDVRALTERTAGWLDEPRSRRGEWAYSRARRCLLVEEMIGDQPPPDLKVWVFDGQPRLVQVDLDRFGGRRHGLYTPEWEFAGGDQTLPLEPALPRPPHLDRVLRVAADLGADFDMIRVDLYVVGDDVWFGELTSYPGSGLQRLTPPGLDLRMGSYWQLPRTA